MNDTKRLFILSDSLALPRLVPETCYYDDTWPAMVKANFNFNVHQVSIGGATSRFLLRQAEYHQAFNPDIVVVQCGIVDCSPRFVTAFEKEIINKIPLFKNKILKFLNKPSVRKKRKITYVSKEEFRSNLMALKKKFPAAQFVFIGIVPGDEQYEKKLPGICKYVEEYNLELKNLDAGFISLAEMPKAGLMSDFHHLNATGHEYVFKALKPFLINV